MGTPASSIGARHTNASRMAILEASLAPIGGRYRTPPVVLAGLGGVSVLAGRLHSATQHPPDRFFPAAISPRQATGSSPSAYGCSRSHSARGPHRPLRGGQLQQALLRRPDPGPARKPSRHGRAWTPDHGGHRLPRCPHRRNRRRADPTTAPPRSRGRTARPAHRAELRAVTCPGVYRSGVGQRLGRGQQHDDAGIAAPRVRGSRRAARPHRDDTLTWAFVERPGTRTRGLGITRPPEVVLGCAMLSYQIPFSQIRAHAEVRLSASRVTRSKGVRAPLALPVPRRSNASAWTAPWCCTSPSPGSTTSGGTLRLPRHLRLPTDSMLSSV